RNAVVNHTAANVPAMTTKKDNLIKRVTVDAANGSWVGEIQLLYTNNSGHFELLRLL
ncbi:hypothetical protein SK128_012356, partial [Halocaridina rubra]